MTWAEPWGYIMTWDNTITQIGIKVSGVWQHVSWAQQRDIFDSEISFVFCKEEEEADSINLETKCEEERRVFAEKTCFNYTSLKTSF